MTDPLTFGFAIVAVLAIPGPTNALLLTSGATVGIRQSLPLLLAEAAGYGISVAIVWTAADFVSSVMPTARIVLSGAVGLYLFALAVALWRTRVAAGARVVLWRQVFVTTLLNPKVLVFALGIIPHGATDFRQYFPVFIGIVPLVGTVWIVGGAFPRAIFIRRGFAVAPKIGATVVACFAVLLIASSIHSLVAR